MGPTVALHMPLGFSLEFDALYRNVGVDYSASGSTATQSVSANSWQFPLLIQWAFLPGPVKPFVDGGVSFQHLTGLGKLTNPSQVINDPTVGFAFGAGIQFKIKRLRIEPEFRYTRWGSRVFEDPLSTILNNNRNQGDFLVGITF